MSLNRVEKVVVVGISQGVGGFLEADSKNIATHVASDLIAEERLEKAKQTTPKLSQNFNNQTWIKL